jgi:hypothetical protein
VRLALLLFLVACGDNIIAPDAPLPSLPPQTGDLNWGVDWGGNGPGECHPATPLPLPVSTHAACCVGLLHGKVPIECTPPPGRCRRVVCDSAIFTTCVK